MSALDVVEIQSEAGIPAAADSSEPAGTYRRRRLGLFFWLSVIWLVVLVLAAIVSGAFYYQSGRIAVRWDQLDPPNAAVLRAAPGLDGPWYAVVSDVEGGEAALRARIPGEWRAVGKLRDVTLWRLDPLPARIATTSA